MAALAARGRRVAPAKVGPDFIDPGYHALATGRPGRTLDPWMSGAGLVPALAARAAAGADVLVVEGVMGLFDGAADGSPSSTADVARLLGAPVVLVVDAAGLSGSVAAVVHGFRTWDPSIRVAGVVLNMVGSDGHEELLRAALAPTGVPVLGALHRDDALGWRSRHLGLVPVVERPAEVAAALDRLVAAVGRRCDLDAIEAVAAAAPPLAAPPLPLPQRRPGPPVRVAVAGGPAFSFCYQDNLDALAAAGAEVVAFDPCRDTALPEGAGVVVAGGGFPEAFADELAANEPLLADLRRHHAGGGVVWAECGGLLWLARELDGRPMAGLVDARAAMAPRTTIGYRQAVTAARSPLGPAGTRLRGHEHHRSTTDPPGDALVLTGRHGTSRGGWATPRLLASYLHLHLAATPHLAEAVVAAAPIPAGAAR